MRACSAGNQLLPQWIRPLQRLRWLITVGLGHRMLELHGGAQCINGTGELDQGAVASELDDPTAARRESLFAALAQAGHGAAFLALYQARMANHICRHDGSQPALLTGHRTSPVLDGRS